MSAQKFTVHIPDSPEMLGQVVSLLNRLGVPYQQEPLVDLPSGIPFAERQRHLEALKGTDGLEDSEAWIADIRASRQNSKARAQLN